VRLHDGEGVQLHSFLKLETKWTQMVNFTPQLLSPQDKKPQLPIDYENVWAPRAGLACLKNKKNVSI
jgi:hypothetical protein